MACERHEEDLSALAFGALKPPRERELRAHLDLCGDCRAKFETRRRLAEAIDRGVAVSVDDSPSPDFMARVRQCIAAEPMPRPAWWRVARPAWVPIAAGAVATLVFVAWMTQRTPDSLRGPADRNTLAGNNSTPPKVGPIQSVPSVAADAGRRSGAGSSRTMPVVPVRTGVRPLHRTDPPVIVPPGQREAVLKLYAAIWSGKTNGAPLAAPPAALDVPELKIAPLAVPPLAGDEKSPQTDGDRPAATEPRDPPRSL